VDRYVNHEKVDAAKKPLSYENLVDNVFTNDVTRPGGTRRVVREVSQKVAAATIRKTTHCINILEHFHHSALVAGWVRGEAIGNTGWL